MDDQLWVGYFIYSYLIILFALISVKGDWGHIHQPQAFMAYIFDYEQESFPVDLEHGSKVQSGIFHTQGKRLTIILYLQHYNLPFFNEK